MAQICPSSAQRPACPSAGTLAAEAPALSTVSPETPLLQGSWVWHPWPLPGPLHPPTAQIPLANTLPSTRFTPGNTPHEPAEAPPASASWAELSGEGRSQLPPLTPAFGGEAPASKDKICRKREGTCTMAGETPETPGDGLPSVMAERGGQTYYRPFTHGQQVPHAEPSWSATCGCHS